MGWVGRVASGQHIRKQVLLLALLAAASLAVTNRYFGRPSLFGYN